MSLRIIAIGVIAVLLGAPGFARGDDYGAIAYSRHSGKYGYATRGHSREDAEERAMRDCHASDCKVEVWFKNQCGALATANHGEVTGWAHDSDLRIAKENALRNCDEHGGHHCSILIFACASK